MLLKNFDRQLYVHGLSLLVSALMLRQRLYRTSDSVLFVSDVKLYVYKPRPIFQQNVAFYIRHRYFDLLNLM